MTSTVPAEPDGAVAVNCESLVTVNAVAGVLPNITPFAPVKPIPERVTVLPPASGPAFGKTPVTTGATLFAGKFEFRI